MSWDPSDAGKRRGYHHGNLREALVAAAVDLISQHGPEGFTVAEAARLAGVSPGAPYRHFRDAEALLAEVAPPDDPALAETIDRLAAAVVRADAESESGRYRRAREMLLAILDQPALARHPPTHALARFTLGEVLSGLGDFKLARSQYTYDLLFVV